MATAISQSDMFKKPVRVEQPGTVERIAQAISVDAAHDLAVESHLTVDQARELDVRQEQYMAAHSPEGRPPEHALRIVEWKGFVVVACILFVAGLIWAFASGVDGPTILMSVAFLLMIIFAAAPAWGAAILRGQEERKARSHALHEIKPVCPGKAETQFSAVEDPENQVVIVKEQCDSAIDAGAVKQ